MIRKGNPDSTTGVLFASLVKSANEPSLEEFFVLIFFSPKNVYGEGGGAGHPARGRLGKDCKKCQDEEKQRSEPFPAVEKCMFL